MQAKPTTKHRIIDDSTSNSKKLPTARSRSYRLHHLLISMIVLYASARTLGGAPLLYHVQAFTTSALLPAFHHRIATDWSRMEPSMMRDPQKLLRHSSIGSCGVALLAFPTHINGDTSAAITNNNVAAAADRRQISWFSARCTQLGMISFIGLMCLFLPLTLLPQRLLFDMKLISRNRMNRWALLSSQWCARITHRLVPFCRIDTILDPPPPPPLPQHPDTTVTVNANEPAIWVCNHTSMLDVFILLICDRRLRGDHRRPIKVIYWKNLESNPITKLLFKQAGFIPVNMAANAPGQDNEYDVKSFKQLLKDSKQAMADGFDLGILPEGQLNPHPEQGVLPVFTGAFTLAKLSKRKIGMMALYNVHKLWGATRGMKVLDRNVKVRVYDKKLYQSADEFTKAFISIVGTFGQSGTDDGPSFTTAITTDRSTQNTPPPPSPSAAKDEEDEDSSPEKNTGSS